MERAYISEFLASNEKFSALTGLSLNLFSIENPEQPLHREFHNCKIQQWTDYRSLAAQSRAKALKQLGPGESVTSGLPLGLSISMTAVPSGKESREYRMFITLEGFYLDSRPPHLNPEKLEKLFPNLNRNDGREIIPMLDSAPRLSWNQNSCYCEEMHKIARLYTSEEKSHSGYHPNIQKALQYIRSHLDEELSLEIVARHSGVSSYHFSRMFSKELGVSLPKYISNLRCNLVVELLKNPHKRVSEIAFEVGFTSLSQFNRSFYEKFGMAPTDYRSSIPEKPRQKLFLSKI